MKELAITNMTVDEWNAEVPIGTRVHFYPVAGESTFEDTRTRSKAWALGHGEVVVKVEGRAGGVSTRHCQIMGIATGRGGDMNKRVLDSANMLRLVAEEALINAMVSYYDAMAVTLEAGLDPKESGSRHAEINAQIEKTMEDPDHERVAKWFSDRKRRWVEGP